MYICIFILIGNREWCLWFLYDIFFYYKYGGVFLSFLELNLLFDEGIVGILVFVVLVGWWMILGCYSVFLFCFYFLGSDVMVYFCLLEIENCKNEFYKLNICFYNINLFYFIKWYFESN